MGSDSSVNLNGSSGSISSTAAALERFSPEPKSRLSASFGAIMNSLDSIASSALNGATQTFAGIDPLYSSLLTKQIEVQQQMQLVSFESNIEKSKHETQMAAVRNIRVG